MNFPKERIWTFIKICDIFIYLPNKYFIHFFFYLLQHLNETTYNQKETSEEICSNANLNRDCSMVSSIFVKAFSKKLGWGSLVGFTMDWGRVTPGLRGCNWIVTVVSLEFIGWWLLLFLLCLGCRRNYFCSSFHRKFICKARFYNDSFYCLTILLYNSGYASYNYSIMVQIKWLRGSNMIRTHCDQGGES